MPVSTADAKRRIVLPQAKPGDVFEVQNLERGRVLLAILLDTNVLIYASTPRSPLRKWARETIAEAVSGDGAAANAVSIAEVCAGDAQPETVADRARSWGIAVIDVPAAIAEPCARAYAKYRERRRIESGMDVSALPLPDFFIGAHAEIMGWTLATADEARFRTYFPPSVTLKSP